MSGDLRGKVVALTGAARGIGAATAAAFVEAGARVGIGDLDIDLAKETAQRLGGEDVALAVRLDVTDPKSFASFLDEVEGRLGPVDVVVNNAGIMPLATLLEEDDAATARILEVNTRALISASREAARRMVARGRGHLVNIASTAGTAGLPGASTYCASKAAVLVFSEAIELELAPHGVAVSAVLPGIVQTELAAGVPDVRGLATSTPEEVATAIVQAVRRPRLQVFVPRSAGPLTKSARLLPRRAGLWLARRMGADQVLLQAAHDPARRAYEERVAPPATAGADG